MGRVRKSDPFPLSTLRIERRHRAARLPEQHQHAARRQAIQALVERRLADRIVDDLNALAAGDPLDLFLEVLARVEHDVVGARLARELRLLVGRHRRDDARAAQLRDLREQQADAAGARVHEARVAGLQRIGGAGEVVRGHALEHHRRALLRRDAGRQRDEPVGRDRDAIPRSCRGCRSTRPCRRPSRW